MEIVPIMVFFSQIYFVCNALTSVLGPSQFTEQQKAKVHFQQLHNQVSDGVVLDGVLGPLRLARYTSPCLLKKLFKGQNSNEKETIFLTKGH